MSSTFRSLRDTHEVPFARCTAHAASADRVKAQHSCMILHVSELLQQCFATFTLTTTPVLSFKCMVAQASAPCVSWSACGILGALPATCTMSPRCSARSTHCCRTVPYSTFYSHHRKQMVSQFHDMSPVGRRQVLEGACRCISRNHKVWKPKPQSQQRWGQVSAATCLAGSSVWSAIASASHCCSSRPCS